MVFTLDSRGTPGYEFFVDSAGATIPSVAVYSRLYLLITSSATIVPVGVPTVVGSMDDFTNLFGSSSAIVLDSIEVYLQNFDQGLYVVRTTPSPYAEITTTAAAGDKTVTINGTAITVTPDASPTLQEIVTAFVDRINNNTTINLAVEAEYLLNASGQPDYTTGKIRLRSKNGATFTVTATAPVTVSTAVSTPVSMNYWDWMGAAKALADRSEDEPLGFLAAPQAFFQITNQFERHQIGNTIEEVCRRLGWFGYLDPHAPATIDHPSKAKVDASGYIATQGHTAYTYPYFVNRDSDFIAPSVAIPAVALRRYRRRGIQEPPAGDECAIDGVSGVQFTLNTAQRVDMAESNININVFQPGVGAMPYDTLTRATNPAFLMINARIILSSFERTLRNTLRSSRLLHRAIDGAGRFYSQLNLTVTGVADLFYLAKALYGETPGQAYFVRCNAAMQNAVDLENGVVRYEVYLVPVPVSRRINGYIYRVAIDQLAQTVAIEAL